MMYPGKAVGLACVLLLQGISPCLAAEDPAAPAQGQAVKVTDVPPAIVSIARSELGAKPSEAREITFEGQPAYELQGINKYDKHLTVVVGRDGKILKPVNIWEADDD